MRVNIDEIKEGGLRRSWDVTREQVDEMVAGDQAGYRARGAAHFDAKLDKLERRVRVDAHGRRRSPPPAAAASSRWRWTCRWSSR